MLAEAAPSSSAPSAITPTGSHGDYVRLHITPLDAELVRIIIPASLQARARNVSFHTIETFPEKRYGFVDLPSMDAEKLTKKLNGSLLKGNKVRIEKARPEATFEPAGDAERADKKRKKKNDGASSTKRQKKDPNVLEGFALRERKVKRGWTESADTKRRSKKSKDRDGRNKEKEKRKRPRSKYTDQEECLLKVKLPPNAMGNLAQADVDIKPKKSKSRKVTVHEFEKTTKFPSFLKHAVSESSGKPAKEFVEGKGWVDEDGNVVETVRTTRPSAQLAKPDAPRDTPEIEEGSDADKDSNVEDNSDDSTSSSGTSSEEEDSEDEEDEEEQSDAHNTVKDERRKQPATAHGRQSPEAQVKPIKGAEHTTPSSILKSGGARPPSSSSSKSLKISIPPPPPLPPMTPSASTIHPLEALYKRPKPEGANATDTPARQPEPFSFFGGGSEEDEAEAEEEAAPQKPGVAMPMTPFSRQDFERRNVRSAAPTPDTAHPTRMRNFWAPAQQQQQEEEEDDEEEETGKMAAGGGDGKPPEQTDFQTWFWDNRRELNRSWMSRRKTAAKEKRHRENKARASKAV
ncbi:hypothetical protein CDD83_1057 [Cordyceps sp. RAO-2017]|nr:hypothetical protein CDD83_1057 [Cordyceps sp. RAO-2017]